MSTILPFPNRRRGRPKTRAREEKDMGTPELQYKRATLETIEALDLCLEKGVITPEQHWCGIHLRWLHTLRYGAPGVRAFDLTAVGGTDIMCDDPSWREAREAEYHDATRLLTHHGAVKLLTDVCIHNEKPVFLLRGNRKTGREGEVLAQFRNGLDLLVAHWKRRKSS